jgi:N-acetylglucosamine-6-phosphate deacetylase
MTPQILRPARVLLPDGFHEGLSLTIAHGVITAIGVAAEGDGRVIDLDGLTLVPGFFDTQVNGGGGVLFNDAPTVEGIAAIVAAHRRFGTTALLPTLISDDLAVVAAALDAVDAAIAAGVPGVQGIHVEGPFLNPARKGIHDPAMLRRIDDAAIALLSRPRRGRVLVTIAPELAPPGAVAALAAAGVVIAAGHSDASYEQAVAAFDAGITGATHLFNAMSPLQSRAPGLVGAILDDDRVTAGIIVDGHHVHPAALRVALRAKSAERLMLVSDAMPTTGGDADDFTLNGRVIHLRDGRLTDDSGTLAGSALSMADAVRNAVRLLGVPLPTAIAMATRVPARLMRLDQRIGSIAPGRNADLLALDQAGEVVRCWVGGCPA